MCRNPTCKQPGGPSWAFSRFHPSLQAEQSTSIFFFLHQLAHLTPAPLQQSQQVALFALRLRFLQGKNKALLVIFSSSSDSQWLASLLATALQDLLQTWKTTHLNSFHTTPLSYLSNDLPRTRCFLIYFVQAQTICCSIVGTPDTEKRPTALSCGGDWCQVRSSGTPCTLTLFFDVGVTVLILTSL